MSSEYGWTDEQIGELPLQRLRQITAAIQMRRFENNREENSRFSWLGKTLATFIAAGYMTDGDNPGIEAAGSIAFDDIEAALNGVKVKSDEPKEPAVGSYERLMMMMHQGGKMDTAQEKQELAQS